MDKDSGRQTKRIPYLSLNSALGPTAEGRPSGGASASLTLFVLGVELVGVVVMIGDTAPPVPVDDHLGLGQPELAA